MSDDERNEDTRRPGHAGRDEDARDEDTRDEDARHEDARHEDARDEDVQAAAELARGRVHRRLLRPDPGESQEDFQARLLAAALRLDVPLDVSATGDPADDPADDEDR